MKLARWQNLSFSVLHTIVWFKEGKIYFAVSNKKADTSAGRLRLKATQVNRNIIQYQQSAEPPAQRRGLCLSHKLNTLNRQYLNWGHFANSFSSFLFSPPFLEHQGKLDLLFFGLNTKMVLGGKKSAACGRLCFWSGWVRLQSGENKSKPVQRCCEYSLKQHKMAFL